MKKSYFIYALLVIVVVLLAWWFATSDQAPGILAPAPDRLVADEAKLLAALKQASVTIPEFNLVATLADGEADFTDGGMVSGSIKLVSVLGQKALADGSYDVFTDMAVETGGTGTFNYVSLFHVSSDGVKNTASTFVGDRVQVQGVTVGGELAEGGYRLSINYLGRSLTDPMAAEPTVADSLEMRVVDHQFMGLKY